MANYIIGIDPSISATGVAILNLDTGEVLTHTLYTEKLLEDSTDDYRRCYELGRGLIHLIVKYNPIKIAIEMPPGSSENARTAKMAGMCVGLLSTFYYKITHFYNAMAIKRLVGYPEVKGTARKRLNIDLCNSLYPNHSLCRNSRGEVLQKENNAADALLLAYMASIDFPLTASSTKSKRISSVKQKRILKEPAKRGKLSPELVSHIVSKVSDENDS